MKILFLSLIFTLTLQANVSNDDRGLFITNDMVMLVVNYETNKSELASYQKTLKDEYNIDLDYSQSVFYTNGKLKEVSLKIDCNDGIKGTLESSDLELNQNEKVGFYKSLKKEHEIKFGVGVIPEIKNMEIAQEAEIGEREKKEAIRIIIHPNPLVYNDLNLSFNQELSETLQYRVYDKNGQVLTQGNIEVNGYKAKISFRGDELINGNLLLIIEGETLPQQRLRFIKNQ